MAGSWEEGPIKSEYLREEIAKSDDLHITVPERLLYLENLLGLGSEFEDKDLQSTVEEYIHAKRKARDAVREFFRGL